MAILQGGSDSVTIEFVDEKIEPIVEETVRRTAGGNLRKTTGGERLQIGLTMRLTPAQYRSLLTLITNRSQTYSYTPEDSTASFWSDLYPDLTFPINCLFNRIEKDWDNRSHWYVTLEMESVEYL
jgi:hypothetical protein